MELGLYTMVILTRESQLLTIMLVSVCDLVGKPESDLDPVHNVEYFEGMNKISK